MTVWVVGNVKSTPRDAEPPVTFTFTFVVVVSDGDAEMVTLRRVPSLVVYVVCLNEKSEDDVPLPPPPPPSRAVFTAASCMVSGKGVKNEVVTSATDAPIIKSGVLYIQ